MATRKREVAPQASDSPPDGGFIEKEQRWLSQAFQALTNPVTRHFIELLAIEPRSKKELARHFDLIHSQIETVIDALVESGFADFDPQADDGAGCVELDRRALDLIRSWLDRIAAAEERMYGQDFY